jgi:hypothetical protein
VSAAFEVLLGLLLIVNKLVSIEGYLLKINAGSGTGSVASYFLIHLCVMIVTFAKLWRMMDCMEEVASARTPENVAVELFLTASAAHRCEGGLL